MAMAAMAAVEDVIVLQDDRTPAQLRPMSDEDPTYLSEAQMNQSTDPEDPYIEDGPEPSTAGEWIDDSREGRDPDQQPQRLDV
jgi:hypothetical protein